jgi:hypothetical protein
MPGELLACVMKYIWLLEACFDNLKFNLSKSKGQPDPPTYLPTLNISYQVSIKLNGWVGG